MEQIGNIIQRKKLAPTDSHIAKPIVPEIINNKSSNLAKALIAFHKTRPFVVEKSENSFFKNKKGKFSTYASLEEAIMICRKAVDFDLTFTQNINFDGNEYFVSTVILHSSGETLSDRTPIKCKDYNDPHKFYGSVSYARRYSILSIFSCPTADNDGVTAMGWVKLEDIEQETDDENNETKLDKAIKNAQSIKELTEIFNKNQPLDDAVKNKFTVKRGELERWILVPLLVDYQEMHS